MRRWLAVIIFNTFGRLFNNPAAVYRLEDKLANSGPVRQLARTIVALYQRGLWEFQRLKSPQARQFQIEMKETSKADLDELIRKFKKMGEELKKGAEKK